MRRIAVVAAQPLPKATPCVRALERREAPLERRARRVAGARVVVALVRAGPVLRERASTRTMGVITAPETGSGSCPAWMQSVSISGHAIRVSTPRALFGRMFGSNARHAESAAGASAAKASSTGVSPARRS